ncbi:hypothetical protein lerEdw1_000261 [Lerista edwardsae]|nr:hypothetical protein lerEdw1_000261 [Lerista edwardsae]
MTHYSLNQESEIPFLFCFSTAEIPNNPIWGAPERVSQFNWPYQCGHCSQSFSQPSELRNHVVTHSSDRPFKCGYCGRAFAGATTLNNHIRTHTGEKPFKQDKTKPNNTPRSSSPVSIFSLAFSRCERCERSFTQATQLSRHQRMPNECKPITESTESIEVD